MREINLNGYIDEAVWLGDEITPEALHELLYDAAGEQPEDVHIRLNSYGGSCNAATRMHDDLAAYPGKVHMTVSGTAASAATVVAMAADRLEMTPGSLWMIHNPSMVAMGTEQDLQEAIEMLRACKESIINVYAKRCRMGHDSISDMMDRSTWMDAQAALMNGFIDNIADSAVSGPTDCVQDRADAEKKVQAWFDRHRLRPPQINAGQEEQPYEEEAAKPSDAPVDVPVEPTIAEAPETSPLATDEPNAPAAPAPDVDAPEPTEPRVHAASLEKRLNSLKLQLV